MTVVGKQDLRCSGEWQLCSSFYPFGIKEGTRGRLHGGGRKQGAGQLTGSCAPLGVVLLSRGLEKRTAPAFQRRVSPGAPKQQTGLAGLETFHWRSYGPRAWLPTLTCRGRHLWSDLPVRRLSVRFSTAPLSRPHFEAAAGAVLYWESGPVCYLSVGGIRTHLPSNHAFWGVWLKKRKPSFWFLEF